MGDEFINLTHIGVESLMPKGVEHESFAISVTDRISSVESLMPKGVEHRSASRKNALIDVRVESLMPKGVEHWINCLYYVMARMCRISDAERR